MQVLSRSTLEKWEHEIILYAVDFHTVWWYKRKFSCKSEKSQKLSRDMRYDFKLLPQNLRVHTIFTRSFCGDLSEAILKLFLTDCSAEMLVLVGCCYHKMNIKRVSLFSVSVIFWKIFSFFGESASICVNYEFHITERRKADRICCGN